MSTATKCTTFIALRRGADRYVYVYEDTPAGRTEALRFIRRHAADPALSLTAEDAEVLSASVNEDDCQAGGTLRFEVLDEGEPAPAWLEWLLVVAGALVALAGCYAWGRGLGLLINWTWRQLWT